MILPPSLKSKKELHDWLHENKGMVIHQKKMTDKKADAVFIGGGIWSAPALDVAEKVSGVIGKN